MQQRGRKKQGDVVEADLSILSTDRVIPPATLTDAEINVWDEVVNDHPADFFTSTHKSLLTMYCRHVVRSQILDQEILSFDMAWLADGDGLDRYDKLLKMAERETRAASSLATRLRITKQALDQQTAALSKSRQKKTVKPWELPNKG